MLEKVPLLNLDQQNPKEQRIGLTISISGIYNWWKSRKREKLKAKALEHWFEEYNFKIEGKENDSSEHTCSIGCLAGSDKIDQRIDAAIARANGDRYGEG